MNVLLTPFMCALYCSIALSEKASLESMCKGFKCKGHFIQLFEKNLPYLSVKENENKESYLVTGGDVAGKQ